MKSTKTFYDFRNGLLCQYFLSIVAKWNLSKFRHVTTKRFQFAMEKLQVSEIWCEENKTLLWEIDERFELFLKIHEWLLHTWQRSCSQHQRYIAWIHDQTFWNIPEKTKEVTAPFEKIITLDPVVKLVEWLWEETDDCEVLSSHPCTAY